MKIPKQIFLPAILIIVAVNAQATLQISVATDKPVYQVGEPVTVSVSIFNPDLQKVTLSFPTTNQISYTIDNTYRWIDHHKNAPQMITYLSIDSQQQITLSLNHGGVNMLTYPLVAGTHSVVGEVLFYGQSNPVEFMVIPEPMTISLLAFGFLLLRRSK